MSVEDRQEHPGFDPRVMGGSIKRGIVNPDLVEERAKCNFDQEQAYKLYYDEDIRSEMEWVFRLLKKYPQVKTAPTFYEMSRREKFVEWWDRFKIIMQDPEFNEKLLNNSHKQSQNWHWWFFFGGTSPMTLHQQMFTKTIKELASEEQVKHYLPLLNHWQIIGCYAQTELGHGSNVAGLETTCTLDTSTDEFVVHSPSIKAAKFWPGNLGI